MDKGKYYNVVLGHPLEGTLVCSALSYSESSSVWTWPR